MRRVRSTLVGLAFTIGGSISLPPGEAATACSVKNAEGSLFSSVQAAVDVADDDDTLRIRGVCVGNSVIEGRSLRLVGVPSAALPYPTLEGDGRQRVMTIRGVSDVVIRDLTITGGSTRHRGGGISFRMGGHVPARLTLRGSTAVVGNRAESSGGGVFMTGRAATLVMSGSAAVSGNVSQHLRVRRRSGGGIDDEYGTVILRDHATVSDNGPAIVGGGIQVAYGAVLISGHASVTGNTARKGAGIFAYGEGTVRLSGEASITGNVAGRRGGGIGLRFVGSAIWLDDRTSIVGNSAGVEGGGIALEEGAVVYRCSDLVAISPNDPDDPPETLPCPQPTSRSRSGRGGVV